MRAQAGLTIGSLFSGIGGLEVGLEWAGVGHVVWQCEVDPYCLDVMAKHWPDAIRYDDVRSMGEDTPRVDVLCGGFPCQDISVAGDQAGLDGGKSGLFWELVRLVRILRPRYLVLENVRALLTSPPGRRGHDFGRVLGALADLGYDAEWHVLRASDAVDAEGGIAPHGRARIIILAWQRVADADGQRELQPQEGWNGLGGRAGDGGEAGQGVADAPGLRRKARGQRDGEGWRPVPGLCGQSSLGDAVVERLAEREGEPCDKGEEFPTAEGAGGGHTQPGVGRDPDGLPARLDRLLWPAWQGEPQHAWEPPREARGVPSRAARIRSLGNAVVPHVARIAGLRLLEIIRSLGR